MTVAINEAGRGSALEHLLGWSPVDSTGWSNHWAGGVSDDAAPTALGCVSYSGLDVNHYCRLISCIRDLDLIYWRGWTRTVGGDGLEVNAELICVV